MGLVVFAVMGLYLVVSIGVVKGAIAYAREKGKNAKRWGWGAALVMYLIPFWDWIPTVAMHQYYCATEAGFWVYKTPEQWKKENPGIAQTLRSSDSAARTTLPNGVTRLVLNERFVYEVSDQRLPLVATYKTEYRFMDTNTGEVIARRLSVGSGFGTLALGAADWRKFKFWLSLKSCVPGQQEFSKYFEQLQKIGEAK